MIHFEPLDLANPFQNIYDCIRSELMNSGTKKAQLHIGNLIFDQHICSESPLKYKSLFYNLYEKDQLIGFLIVEDDSYYIYLKSNYETLRSSIITLVESTYFSKGTSVITTANLTEVKQVTCLKNNGYSECIYYRFNGIYSLSEHKGLITLPNDYHIRRTLPKDTKQVVQLIQYATGRDVSHSAYETMRQDPETKNTDEWVVADADDVVVAYSAFWNDPISKTAVLEPVACMETHRKLGLTKALLNHGLSHLKNNGIETAYVSTSGTNTASQALYGSVGFRNYGWEYEFSKQL